MAKEWKDMGPTARKRSDLTRYEAERRAPVLEEEEVPVGLTPKEKRARRKQKKKEE